MITRTLMERCFPTRGLNPTKYNLVKHRDDLIRALNEFLPKYKITTYNRVRAFLSCGGYETDYFKTTSEYASGADYERRGDLGNTQKGDGRKFKGGGVFMTTGRYNYRRVMIRFVKKLTGVDYSKDLVKLASEATRLGVNFLDHPELLRDDLRVAVEAACIFWEENNLAAYADAGQIKQLNGVVNRGSASKTALGWPDREALYEKLATVVPKDISFSDSPAINVAIQNPVAPVPAPAPQDDNSDDSATDTPTPVDPAVKPIDMDKAQPLIDSTKGTLQSPAVKTVAARAGIRLGGGLATVWASTAGKVALVLTGVVILGVAGGFIYSYRKHIVLGYEIVVATIKKSVGGIF